MVGGRVTTLLVRVDLTDGDDVTLIFCSCG